MRFTSYVKTSNSIRFLPTLTSSRHCSLEEIKLNKEDAIALLDKKIGPNSEIIGYDKFINTSYEPLNKVISGKYDGGLPYGRIVE